MSDTTMTRILYILYIGSLQLKWPLHEFQILVCQIGKFLNKLLDHSSLRLVMTSLRIHDLARQVFSNDYCQMSKTSRCTL